MRIQKHNVNYAIRAGLLILYFCSVSQKFQTEEL